MYAVGDVIAIVLVAFCGLMAMVCYAAAAVMAARLMGGKHRRDGRRTWL